VTVAETIYNTESDLRRTANKAADTASNMASQASNMASQAADNVSNIASDLRDKAVNRLSETATYFREHDVQAITNDVKGWVKANPTQALIGAVAIGFLAGALLRRR
jgi:ElaB/YqjD/DUF883 family membrane-anchored ribosome-binding protein